MKDKILEIQAAIISQISQNNEIHGLKIYGNPPLNPSYPYLYISSLKQQKVDGISEKITLTVNIYSNKKSTSEVLLLKQNFLSIINMKNMQKAMRDFKLISLTSPESGVYFTEDKTIVGYLIFEFLI